MTDPDDPPPIRLDQISTHVATLKDAERFLFRYGPAVEAYLRAVLRDPDAAEEVKQELFTRFLARDGGPGWPGRGRFRDYLKTAARNAALTYFRKRTRAPGSLPADLAAPADADRDADSAWRQCLLDRVWRELDARERRTRGSLVYTTLRIFTERRDLDSPAQAALAAEKAGRPVSAEAFRQQVSRGKRVMAELILHEIARTVAAPTAADVEAELCELGLIGYVRDYLPDDWKTRFFGP